MELLGSHFKNFLVLKIDVKLKGRERAQITISSNNQRDKGDNSNEKEKSIFAIFIVWDVYNC